MDALEPRFLLSADLAPCMVDMAAHAGHDHALTYGNPTHSAQVRDRVTGPGQAMAASATAVIAWSRNRARISPG